MTTANQYDTRQMSLGGPTEQVAGLPTFSAVNGITATPSGTQATGVPITSIIARISICATAGDAVTLPAARPGLDLTLANAGAASCNVFPALGDTINALSVNAAFAVAAGKTVSFFCANSGQWHSLLSA